MICYSWLVLNLKLHNEDYNSEGLLFIIYKILLESENHLGDNFQVSRGGTVLGWPLRAGNWKNIVAAPPVVYLCVNVKGSHYQILYLWYLTPERMRNI